MGRSPRDRRGAGAAGRVWLRPDKRSRGVVGLKKSGNRTGRGSDRIASIVYCWWGRHSCLPSLGRQECLPHHTKTNQREPVSIAADLGAEPRPGVRPVPVCGGGGDSENGGRLLPG